ncbi:transcriptional activator FtrA [Luteitalea pratensis]|uniref:Transcriptional activator FtrA n=1 Tax=Luteitalea pratensis TaxID=1855912 RepID=A0A143PHA1_LUTPR|nr:helix-turn-helix domain-containing protein [Luteitalea pratensis]AMY07660.1 transcriptional activator FtrA [Luteitalea pratensis]
MLHARRPRPPLDACVTVLWTVTAKPGPRRLERVLPTGTAQIVINLAEDRTRGYDEARGFAVVESSGSVLCGPSTRYGIIDTDEQYDVVGACIAPGGLPSLLAAPAAEFAETEAPLDALWGTRAIDRLRACLLEARTADARLDVLETALLAHWREAPLHPSVACALDAFARRAAVTTVGDAVAAAGVSARHLIDRFTAQVGLTPKRFCRVRRFQRAIAVAHRGAAEDWAAIAADCGFSDQSHLIHEFRAFAGLPPSAYLDHRTPHRNHVTFLDADGMRVDG